MTKKPIVVVSWNDAYGGGVAAYDERDIPHEGLVIHTLGWLMRDDEKGVSVATEWCADETYRGLTFVPRGMVIAVKPVKKVRVKKVPV